VDRLLDELVICGTPESVADQIMALREQAGPFGEIVYAGMDWVDPALAKRSMVLMAEKVMPKIK
jgi:alkanesulfonate monooxygenase SsuD/methylene tetrahydromethanopterin reductase-like flavin-dependent oxidoreductase (luciferase family)